MEMAAQDADGAPRGLWKPNVLLKNLHYGPGCVEQHLLSALPAPTSKAVIVTGTSLATKTPLVKKLEDLLGERHAGTISGIRQHGPIADVERAVEKVLSLGNGIDTLVSLGGGSPIDTAKVISLRVNEKRGTFLTHLTIPTTLSAAECTAGGGYTAEDGVKIGFRVPQMGASGIFYDAQFARYTPKELWLSTGMRAMDHAVECIYHPTAAEVPWKVLSLWAAGELFELLPKARDSFPDDESAITRLMLAAYASSGLKGENIKGGMGLSHSLGHALGSPYGISHGITSCMTLGKVVNLKATESKNNAKQIARLLPSFGGVSTGDDFKDAKKVGVRITGLVESLKLDVGTLSSKGVSEDEIPIIASRALGGAKEGPLYQDVVNLVKTLF